MIKKHKYFIVILTNKIEDRICYSKYGWSKWALVTDNSEIMKIDLD